MRGGQTKINIVNADESVPAGINKVGSIVCHSSLHIATGPDKEWFIPVTWGESEELKLSQWISISRKLCATLL